jgi:hypothetical protein
MDLVISPVKKRWTVKIREKNDFGGNQNLMLNAKQSPSTSFSVILLSLIKRVRLRIEMVLNPLTI